MLGHAQALFGDCVDYSSPQYWAGLRPMTPTGIPIVDRSPSKMLWLNTGHGHMGWTMSNGCAHILSDLIARRPPGMQLKDCAMAMSETGVSADDCEIFEHLEFTTEKAIGSRARIAVVVLGYRLHRRARVQTDHQNAGCGFLTRPGFATIPRSRRQTLAAMGSLLTETAELILQGRRGQRAGVRLHLGLHGHIGEEAVDERLSAAKPGAISTKPVNAAFAAFDVLGASRIAVLTPYRRDVNDIVRNYIQKRGYEVPVFGSFNEEHDPTAVAIDGDSLRRAVQTITEGRQVDAVVRVVHAVESASPMRWRI